LCWRERRDLSVRHWDGNSGNHALVDLVTLYHRHHRNAHAGRLVL
jgi:hypothetical protein